MDVRVENRFGRKHEDSISRINWCPVKAENRSLQRRVMEEWCGKALGSSYTWDNMAKGIQEGG